jgi:hypothetical protein
MPDLTGSAAVDVLIGLAFVYLLFSLFCSAIQEAIAAIWDWRARNLEKALRGLLEDRTAGETGSDPSAVATGARNLQNLTQKFYGHGLIRGLYQDARGITSFGRNKRGPSYIHPRTFATTLLDLLAPDSPDADNPVAAVRDSIQRANLPAGTKQSLMVLVKEVGTSRDGLRAEIEGWFDAAMARASGWYRRKAQLIICLLSLVVAIGLNVNTFAIADRLVRDEPTRTAVAQQAIKLSQSQPLDENSVDRAAKNIEDARKLGVPIGWAKKPGDPAYVGNWKHIGLHTWGGWLLTFIALSLGAPFWFDTLSKLARLRTTGKPEAPPGATPAPR